ncbi:MAG: selenocysteine-specific translation elongation factor, partial [Acidobacteria bacterium]|nr:selenocysteine-specific translation elongation factor [Acidobacteriota bacterium]
MRHIIIGTAGHIDHGKSALVRALTGTDPDRLKEEKLRGITIDLGFAHLDLGTVSAGIVDVPGHERFVRNMLAGVGGIDIVLLVVAADESIMPQTREHFDICRLLGIRNGIAVITKVDLVETELIELVCEDIRETVRGTFMEGAPILSVSSSTGEGIEELKCAIREMAMKVPSRPADRLLRLPVDRAFSMRGFGTVVTGTLTSGELRKDQDIELIPGETVARVRGIQVHGQPAQVAVAGQRTAVNLQGLDLAQVARGHVITAPGLFRATQLLDVRLNLLPGAQPLRHLVKVRFHEGTSEVLARVALLGKEILEPGETAFAQMRLDSPVFSLHGDAFIIRRFSPPVTIGGGKVLHPSPTKHRSTDSRIQEALAVLDGGSFPEKIAVFLESHPRRALDLRELNSYLGLTPATIREHVERVTRSSAAVLVPAPVPILVEPRLFSRLEEATLELVSRFHADNPLLKGISREELRTRVFRDLPVEVFRYCLERLAETRRISLQDQMVALHGRGVELSEESLRLRDRLEAVFRKSGYQPPLLGEVIGSSDANPEETRRVLFWMIREKILVKVSEDLVYHREVLEEIKSRIRSGLAPGSKFGVAEFKQLFDLTRKYAIPLLEYLDRER